MHTSALVRSDLKFCSYNYVLSDRKCFTLLQLVVITSEFQIKQICSHYKEKHKTQLIGILEQIGKLATGLN
jgi:hypothetical protein